MRKASFNIRLSKPEDATLLGDIWRRAVLATHDFLAPHDFADIEHIVTHEYLPHTVVYLVVNPQDVPLGFMGVTVNHIDTLFIDPDYHGMGIGRILVDYITALLSTDISVHVNEQNPLAIGFYAKMGFEQISRMERDPDGRPYPVLHLVKKYQEKS